MADVMSLRFLWNAFTKKLDWVNDTIMAALMIQAHVPVQTNNVWADVSADEVAAGAGYLAGGVTLGAGKTATQADPLKLDANDIQWVGLTKAFRYLWLYDTTIGTSDLIVCFDLGNQTVSGVTLNIVWNVAGVITATPP